MDQTAPLKLPRESHQSYRDELNFAEFPLASVSTSLPKGQKTLEFTDTIFDSGPVRRAPTIEPTLRGTGNQEGNSEARDQSLL